MIKVLGISGSLRAQSSNSRLIAAASRLLPAGAELTFFSGVDGLPYFSPDLDTQDPPAPVLVLRELVGKADGLLISSPEYAHGVPGALKNALDWLVASVEFPEKPVMLFGGGEYAQAQLAETLRTMSARVLVNELVPAPRMRSAFDANGEMTSGEIRSLLEERLARFVSAIRSGSG